MRSDWYKWAISFKREENDKKCGKYKSRDGVKWAIFLVKKMMKNGRI